MFQERIIRESLAQVRTFLDEVANGTANYRTLHSLNEQVEHQYHGRFAIELLQNAHDALREGGRTGRVEFRLRREEGEFGTLYIANDGQPFLEKDFLGLARLGQSSKNPEESVGNKGLGFRSVLEVSSAPEVYSRVGRHSADAFGGYCFSFDPHVVRQLAPAVQDLASGCLDTPYPLAPEHSLVSWHEQRLREFQARVSAQPHGWLESELTQLSPYLLPLPLRGARAAQISEYADVGLATVVRLPLISEAALGIVSARLSQLAEDEVAILFLEHLEFLRIWTNRDDVVLRRISRKRGDALQGERVTVTRAVGSVPVASPKGPEPRRSFWLWTREFGGDNSPAEALAIQHAAASLPGRWPEIKRATLSVAVEVSLDDPKPGRYSIVLPTELPTGFAAHFSGPFYGTMDRRSIHFDTSSANADGTSLNVLFLQYLARMVADVVDQALLGKGLQEAAAILDLLAPLPQVRQHAALFERFLRSARPLVPLRFVFTDMGWCSGSEARLLDPIRNARVLTPGRLRKLSPFPLVREELRPRYPALQDLLKQEIGHGGALMGAELAKVIGRAARAVADSSNLRWDDFWRDVREAFPYDRASLRGVRVLLGSDQQLHAPGGRVRVFFPPLHGLASGTESELISTIPECLQSRLAFLNESIPLYEARDGGGIRTNDIHAYLSASPRFVHGFGVESILDQVVLPGIPALPAAHESPEAEQCHQILRWTRRLLQGREVASLAAKLQRLPVPARGGWVAAGGASFGPGWGDPLGELLVEFLMEAGTLDTNDALDRVLLPQDESVWQDLGGDLQSFLRSLGVVRGLRLREVELASTVSISAWSIQVPKLSPPGLSPFWNEYRAAVEKLIKHKYQGLFDYQFEPLLTIPGLAGFDRLSQQGRLALARVVLGSMTLWPREWRKASLRKIHGVSHSNSLPSPLEFTLRCLPWLATGQGETREFDRPSALWLVRPELLRTGEYQYMHLRPLSLDMVQGITDEAVSTLASLGTPVYRPGDTTPSSRLLEDLASAWLNHASDINQDRFVGQIRSAWQDFHPDGTSRFPQKLVVRVGQSLQVRTPSAEQPIYLPDAPTSHFGPAELEKLPVLEIVPPQAARLASAFEAVLGSAVRRISTLELKTRVSGVDWSPDANAPLLRDSNLRWLIPPVLAAVAFQGTRPYGTETQGFQQAVKRLQGARLFEARDINLQLVHRTEVLASVPVASWWDVHNEVLVVARNHPDWLESLSEPLSQLVSRADLGMPLRLLLVSLGENADPDLEDLLAALRRLDIDEKGLRVAKLALVGDLAWIIERSRPVRQLLAPVDDPGELYRQISEPELREELRRILPESLPLEEFLEMCRSSSSDRDLGLRLHERLGKSAELENWNQALMQLGHPYVIVTSTAVKEDFSAHALALRASLRAVARFLAHRSGDPTRYHGMKDLLEGVACPDWDVRYWNATFQQVASSHVDVLAACGADLSVLDLFRCNTSVEELNHELEMIGVEPSIDPADVQARNQRNLQSVLDQVIRIALVWCEDRNIAFEDWISDSRGVYARVEQWAFRTGFVDPWSDAECYRVALSLLPQSDAYATFWQVAGHCAGPVELREKLGLPAGTLDDAEEQIRRLRANEERKKRLVEVCGKEFDSDAGNLTQLWSHITELVPDGAAVDLSALANLAELQSTRRVGQAGGQSGKKKGASKRLSQREKDLLGLAGEIHSFRALQHRYGSDHVSAANWVSENSRYCFPNNGCDDELGYDFELTVGGRRILVEVKATQDESEILSLGESQVRAALRATRQRRQYLLLRVSHALSANPQLEVLPNPYDPKAAKYFSFEEAGMRIRFHRQPNPEHPRPGAQRGCQRRVKV
jgi:hypothetical protein